MEARTKSKTTSRDGTSSTEARRSKGTAVADHARKVDRDLGRLLSAMAGLATRIRQELPVRRDPASTRNVYGEQQLELDVWMNDLFVDALRGSKLVAQVASEEMGGVKEFVQEGGARSHDFLLIEDGLRLPSKGKLYGVGGHRDRWIPEVKAFVGELERELMNLRYGGSFVGDFNQILHYGGFFAYPAEVDKPAGKYRLHFESNPIAFIAEAAGGAGTTGKERILDLPPKGIEQTVPTYVGNQDLVERFRSRF